MSVLYFDYRFKFPITSLTTALNAFAALRIAGLLGTGDLPENMLGDYRDAQGNIADPSSGTVAWCGRQGSAGNGDPTQYYIAIRATVTPGQLVTVGFDPSTYGLIACDAAENAAVLGVWA